MQLILFALERGQRGELSECTVLSSKKLPFTNCLTTRERARNRISSSALAPYNTQRPQIDDHAARLLSRHVGWRQWQLLLLLLAGFSVILIDIHRFDNLLGSNFGKKWRMIPSSYWR